MAVPAAAELAGPLVAEPAEELVDLSGQDLLKQALRALADELLEGVVGCRDRCSRGQDLVPCRHGVASRIDPAHRAEVGDKHLEGYAVFVPALSGSSPAIPQVLVCPDEGPIDQRARVPSGEATRGPR
jgi:hypothetical protein